MGREPSRESSSLPPAQGTRTGLAPSTAWALRRVGRYLWENRVSAAITGASVAAGVGVFFLLGLLGLFDLGFVLRYLPDGVGPATLSLEFTTFTFALGFGAALGLGLVRAYPPRRPAPYRPRAATGRWPGLGRWVGRSKRVLGWTGRWSIYGFASGYVAAVRGTPFLVQLNIVYLAVIFTTPRLDFLGWYAQYWAGFFALLINTTGYQAEAFRGGFQSIDPGQIEAAQAVGLTRFQVFRKITLPQGLRLVTLPLANEWISNFKTATILEVIGVIEIYYWARGSIALQLARPIEAFVLLSVFYLLINVTVSHVVTYIERVRRIPGLGTPAHEVPLATRFLGRAGRGTGGR